MMEQIEQSLTRHIIPFRYAQCFEGLTKLFENPNKYSLSDDVFKGPVRIHEYIKDVFRGDNGICRKVKVLETADIPLFLPKNKRRSSYCEIYGNTTKGIKAKYRFNIEALTLYLFKSGVGFLVVDYDLMTQDLNTFIEGNYFLQALKSDNIKKMIFTRKVGRDTIESEPANLLDTFDTVLSTLNVTSFMERGKQLAFGGNAVRYPVEAMTFSSVLLAADTLNEYEIKKSANLISKGYKSSYKCSDESIEESLIKGFDNLVWSVSREGIVSIGSRCNDDVTNAFLENSFHGNNPLGIPNIYFYIYLIVLNQKFTLIKIASDISSKMCGLDFGRDRNAIKKALLELRGEIAQLMLSGIFYDISSNSQYHWFYEKTRETLGIDDLMSELEVETEGLDSITEMLRIQDDEEKENRIRSITKYGSIFVVLFGAWDVSELIRGILQEQLQSTLNLPITSIVAGVFALVAFAVFFMIESIENGKG